MAVTSINRIYGFCAGLAVSSFSCGGGGGTPSGSSDGATGSAASGCPLTLTADGKTYNAVSCVVQGAKTFSAGLYKVSISAAFDTAATAIEHRIRSVSFGLNDGDEASATHVRNFPVSVENPGVTATYNVTQFDSWATLNGPMVNIGSGSFTVTEYDRVNKYISGSFDIVVKKGAESKTITGSLTHVPMKVAE